MKLELSREILEKFSNINFHENPSSGIQFDLCGQTNMTKLTVGCRNFGKAPKTDFAILHALTVRTELDIRYVLSAWVSYGNRDPI